MTKELSKQICEICGIEPEIKYIMKPLDREFICNKEHLINIFKDEDKNSKKLWKVKKVIKSFIDFSKPENFVKLLELPLDNNNTLGGFINEHFVFSNRETFLKSLKLAFLKKPSIKQSLREAEWKYE